jgi:hypothetical protein
MIKLTAAVCKRDDWTVDEWLSHYKERHGPLSASVRNFTRHGVRYLQNYALHSPLVPDFPEASKQHVGVSELWFPSVEALRTAYVEPDYMKYLRTDELRFCKFDGMQAGVGAEVVLHEPGTDLADKRYAYQERAKIFVYRTGASGDRGALQKAWREKRAPALMATAHFKRYARRYLQTHMLDVDVGIPGGVQHHVIDEIWFATTHDAVAYWSAYRCDPADSRADEALLRSDSSWAIFAREHEVFGPLPD